ncbi:hypothetical protein AB5N19_13231 [Seiridium cardinale]
MVAQALSTSIIGWMLPGELESEGGTIYGEGTEREGSPYLEALPDASGWVWYIPLHTGKVSVGVVMNQDKCTAKKREVGLDGKHLYLEATRTTPGVSGLLQKANLVADAPACASPYVRMADDAACFIDPYFSSGVHLALIGGMSAAITVAASIRGNCDELQASSWHSKKVAESYTKLLMDWDENSFDRAFEHFRLIIYGTIDVYGKLSQVLEAEKEAVVKKMRDLGVEHLIDGLDYEKGLEELEVILSPEKVFRADVLANIFGEGKVNAQKQPTEQNFSLAIEVMEVEIEATPNIPVEVKA